MDCILLCRFLFLIGVIDKSVDCLLPISWFVSHPCPVRCFTRHRNRFFLKDTNNDLSKVL